MQNIQVPKTDRQSAQSTTVKKRKQIETKKKQSVWESMESVLMEEDSLQWESYMKQVEFKGRSERVWSTNDNRWVSTEEDDVTGKWRAKSQQERLEWCWWRDTDRWCQRQSVSYLSIHLIRKTTNVKVNNMSHSTRKLVQKTRLIQ